MSDPVTVEQHIDASPADVYALVSDLPRMGEWSPENNGGRWTRGGGPKAGARFVGRNGSGWRRWTTLSVVQTADPGRAFGFRVSAFGVPISYWEYRFAADGDGCTVSESWTDLRPRAFVPFGGVATGVKDRTTFNRQSMTDTLAALKAAAEE